MVHVGSHTNIAVHPSVIHDRNRHEGHDTDAHQEVTDGQINDEH